MSAFGNKFGNGNPYWNINEVSRETRMNKSREFGSLWHQQIFSGAHQEDDPVKDGELFDFDGRISSSEGRFPIFSNVMFFTENDDVFSAKTNFRRTIGVFRETNNILPDNDRLDNWTVLEGGSSLTSYEHNGHYFCKIYGDGTNTDTRIRQTVPYVATSHPYYSFVLKKGTAENSRIRVYSASDILVVDIDWDSESITTTGSEFEEHFWTDDDVLIINIIGSNAFPSSGVIYLELYGEYGGSTVLSSNNYMYATAFIISPLPYIVPFTGFKREKGGLAYEYEWNNRGTIEFWFKNYNITTRTGSTYLISDDFNHRGTTGTNHHIRIGLTNDPKLFFEINNNSTTITIQSSTFTSNSNFREWHHVKACWDVENDHYELYLDGSQVGSSTTDLGTWSPNNILNILSTPLASYGSSDYTANALICDLLIKSYMDTSTHHYLLNKPYYIPNEITSENTNFVISDNGIDIKKGGINVSDITGRTILLGGGSGLQAYSKSGDILHDIPKSNVEDLIYGGHIYFLGFQNLSSIITTTVGDTNSDTSYSTTENYINTSLDSIIPKGMVTARALLCSVSVLYHVAYNKTALGTTASAGVFAKIKHENIGDTVYYVAYIESTHTASDADDATFEGRIYNQAIIPINWVYNTPYITTYFDVSFYFMSSTTGQYYATLGVYPIGLLI